jgi:transposase, IS30 family
MWYLSEHERLLIYRWLVVWENKYEIAEKLWRSHTTISREIIRNSNNKWEYDPIQAEKKYRERRKETNKARCKLLNDDILRNEIEIRLQSKEEDWSPDDLVGRMKGEWVACVCTKTVYNYINKYNPEWKKYLKYKRWYRKAKRWLQWKVNENLPSIDDRPKIVETRKRIWDWEADTVISKWRNCALLTCNERKIKYVLIKKVENCKAETIHNATLTLLNNHKDRIYTITIDNGKEFWDAEITQIYLWVQYYKAHAYHSRERWSNEHTNGMIRKWLPKWSDFSSITDEEIIALQNKLNKKPRKILKYTTPYELFHGVKLAYFSHMCVSK